MKKEKRKEKRGEGRKDGVRSICEQGLGTKT